MKFEEFRIQLEEELINQTSFELQEYCYQPFSFGNGQLAYRIQGVNFRLTYDGRDNQLTIEASQRHQKYSEANWHTVTTLDGLTIQIEEVIEILLKE